VIGYVSVIDSPPQATKQAGICTLFQFKSLLGYGFSMKHPHLRHSCIVIFIVCLLSLFFPSLARATQGHGGVEGVHVHQFAHLFFIFSMGIFIYWLRKRALVKETGWRYLQYSALFFILWNMDAFTVHLLEEQLVAVKVTAIDALRISVSPPEGFPWLGYIYYLAKLDHLLCVPAMFCLYQALRRLLGASPANGFRSGG
jgi:hypothetical protein